MWPRHWDLEAFEAAARARHALRRGGQPDEVVGAALYFASDASSFTTGAVAAGGRRHPLTLRLPEQPRGDGPVAPDQAAGLAPGTVTVSVSTPERSTAPGVAPVSSPVRTISVPLTSTCSIPSASA